MKHSRFPSVAQRAFASGPRPSAFYFFSVHASLGRSIVYIAVSLRERVRKSNISPGRLGTGGTSLASVSPHLDYNFRSYIRNVIIGMYTSHMGSNRCALVHTSIDAESSRQRQIPRNSRPPGSMNARTCRRAGERLKVS